MKTRPKETYAKTIVQSEPSLSFETSMFSENNQDVNASLKVSFACNQSSELFQAHSRALG